MEVNLCTFIYYNIYSMFYRIIWLYNKDILGYSREITKKVLENFIICKLYFIFSNLINKYLFIVSIYITYNCEFIALISLLFNVIFNFIL
jgi:hypothetical protein